MALLLYEAAKSSESIHEDNESGDSHSFNLTALTPKVSLKLINFTLIFKLSLQKSRNQDS